LLLAAGGVGLDAVAEKLEAAKPRFGGLDEKASRPKS